MTDAKGRPGRHFPLDRETYLLRASGCIKVAGVRAQIRARQDAEDRVAARDPRFAELIAKAALNSRIERIRYWLGPIRQDVDSHRSAHRIDRSHCATIIASPVEYADSFETRSAA